MSVLWCQRPKPCCHAPVEMMSDAPYPMTRLVAVSMMSLHCCMLWSHCEVLAGDIRDVGCGLDSLDRLAEWRFRPSLWGGYLPRYSSSLKLRANTPKVCTGGGSTRAVCSLLPWHLIEFDITGVVRQSRPCDVGTRMLYLVHQGWTSSGTITCGERPRSAGLDASLMTACRKLPERPRQGSHGRRLTCSKAPPWFNTGQVSFNKYRTCVPTDLCVGTPELCHISMNGLNCTAIMPVIICGDILWIKRRAPVYFNLMQQKKPDEQGG